MAFEVLTINEIVFNATGSEPEAVYLIPIPPTHSNYEEEDGA